MPIFLKLQFHLVFTGNVHLLTASAGYAICCLLQTSCVKRHQRAPAVLLAPFLQACVSVYHYITIGRASAVTVTSIDPVFLPPVF